MAFVPDAAQPTSSEGKFVPDEKPATTGNPSVDTFRDRYSPAATKAGQALNVDPNLLLGQWGHETGWGKSIIPGTNNLGNIKGKGGVAAKDNMLGTTDTYAKYKDDAEFVDNYVNLLKSRYPGAVGAGKDAAKFTAGLKGYAEDPNYAKKVTSASQMLGQGNSPQTSARPQAVSPQAEKRPDGMMSSVGKNIVAGADIVASLPGAVVGPLAAATGRWVAIAQGASEEDTAKFGHEFGQTVTEKLSNPINQLLDYMGVDYSYTDSGVSKAMGKVSEAIEKGADYIHEKSGGFLRKEDAQDLVNAAALLVAPGAIKLTSKALLESGRAAKNIVKGKPVAPGEAILRETEDSTAQVRENNPAPAPTNATPQTLAKQHIEETTGISRMKERSPQYEKQRKADARAAFAEDPQYADYLKNYADEEVNQRTKTQLEAAQIEQARKIEAIGKGVPEKPPITTWQEVAPIFKKPGFERTADDLVKIRDFNNQKGAVEPEMLAKMAAVGLGVTAGIYLDPEHKIEGALLGAAGGYGVAKVGFKAGDSWKSVKQFFGPDVRIRINDFANHWEESIMKAGRAIYQDQARVMETARDTTSRTKITNWIQGDKTIKLTDAEYAAAKDARAFFTKMGEEGLDSGVLTNLLDDYVTNLWDLEGVNKSAWANATNGMSPTSKFNIQRKIKSLEEGKKLGLKPVTEDVAVIMGIYGNSLSRTMANKQFIDTLKSQAVPDSRSLKGDVGQKLIMAEGAAPKGYVQLGHGQLRGQMIHPDIAPSLKFVFDSKHPTGVLAGIEGLNMAVKRLNVAFSFFHAKALADAFIGAGGNPVKLIGMVANTNKFLKMIREGGAGDIVDKAYEGGLTFTLPKGEIADIDIGGSFYKTMENVRKIADDAIPGAGRFVKGIENINHGVDTIMWERLHAGMKLETFAKTHEVLKINNAKAHLKDPSIPLKTDKQISVIAASFSNDLFGGLNWRRAAEETQSAFARDIALKVASPSGRRIMQMLLFAPDWTLSTTRAAVKAFGKGAEQHGEGVAGKIGAGLKGLIKPQELADLHRQYLLRSAAYYFTVGNALNYALSGHSILQNKDKTTLELGDGRTMQFSKHMMEPVHWLTKPWQQALNKLGLYPSEIIEQAASQEYLSARGAPPMEPGVTGHARHALHRLVPISGSNRDFGSNVSGALGFPIEGRTEKQKREDKKKARERRRKEREK